MGGAIAAGVSATKHLSGQEHRSGPNFRLLETYNAGALTVTAPEGFVFDIMEDVSPGKDPTRVSNATNGTKIPGDALHTGKNYYIANPEHAAASFAITLTET